MSFRGFGPGWGEKNTYLPRAHQSSYCPLTTVRDLIIIWTDIFLELKNSDYPLFLNKIDHLIFWLRNEW
jgi:hypothetical protein